MNNQNDSFEMEKLIINKINKLNIYWGHNPDNEKYKKEINKYQKQLTLIKTDLELYLKS
jgi:hypothetical protein